MSGTRPAGYVSPKLIPLTANPFGLVIVTVIVVVDATPTGTVEGLNDFDIVRGSPWARSRGPHAAMMRLKSTKRRIADIDSGAPWLLLEEYSWRDCAGASYLPLSGAAVT